MRKYGWKEFLCIECNTNFEIQPHTFNSRKNQTGKHICQKCYKEKYNLKGNGSKCKQLNLVCVECNESFTIRNDSLQNRTKKTGDHICRECYKKYTIKHSSKRIIYNCIECRQEFESCNQAINKRPVQSGKHICQSCYKKYASVRRSKVMSGKKHNTPHKKVRGYENGKTILKPTSQRNVWAKCEVCDKSFQQQFKVIFEKEQEHNMIVCNKCVYSVSGKQRISRIKHLWHSDTWKYTLNGLPLPLDLALKYSGRRGQYPIVFDCKVCGKEEHFHGIDTIRHRQHYPNEPICKKCYYQLPEYKEQKSKNYMKRLDKPLAKHAYHGVFHSKWGDIKFESRDGELLYLVLLEQNSKVKNVKRGEPIKYVLKDVNRNYFPDFIVEYYNRKTQIVEVKGWVRDKERELQKKKSVIEHCKSLGYTYKFVESKTLKKPSKDWVPENRIKWFNK